MSPIKQIALALVIISAGAFVSMHTTKAARNACERGSISRANIKYLLKDRIEMAMIQIKSGTNPTIVARYKLKLPEYKQKYHNVATVNCDQENQYFGLFQ